MTKNEESVGAQTQAQTVDGTQPIEQNAYVPTYKVKPEFRQLLLKAIGDRPFNEIAGLIQAVNVEIIDHQTLTQVMNAIGNFPFIKVEPIMTNIGSLVTQVVED